MVLGGGGGGDDRLQVGTIVFCIVISFVITTAVPFLVPDYSSGDTAQLYKAREEVGAYTGESMVNLTPWQLTGIFTPYQPGTSTPDNPHLTDSGWLYGEEITSGEYAQYLGKNIVKLDPQQYSNRPLSQSETEDITVINGLKWYYRSTLGDSDEPNPLFMIVAGVANVAGVDVDPYKYKTVEAPRWDYSGYRYEFTPYLNLLDENGDPKPSATDARLSVVWYKEYSQQNGQSSQGLSGGLVLLNDRTNGIVANLTAGEIVERYDVNSSYSTRYTVDFDGLKLWFNIRFDTDVITQGNLSLDEAFNRGYWSLAVTAVSASNLLDLQNSVTLSSSIGNILDTYTQIFTFSMPDVPLLWSMVLWIICILPLDVAILMFLSRFGVMGVGAGIIGTVLATVIGSS